MVMTEPKFKAGDVVFFKPKKFSIYSTLIRINNFINYRELGWTHVGIIGEVKPHSIIIYEALTQGFVASEYGKGELQTIISQRKAKIKRPKIRVTKVKDSCEQYLGRPYGWIDVFQIGVGTIFNLMSLFFAFNDKLRLVVGSFMLQTSGASKLQCSEAVARVLYDSSNKKINFQEEFGKKYSLITPHDLAISKQLVNARN